MKKILCIALALMMLAAVTIACVPAGAEDVDLAQTGDSDVLIVTANGTNPTEVKVGNEFVLFVGLYAGEEKILDGQTHMEYDTEYLSFDPYEVTISYEDNGEIVEYTGMEYYSFPAKIRDASLVHNYNTPGIINYNFTKASGIKAINDPTKLFARFRFKAVAPGTTDILHDIQYMVDCNEQHIYYKGVALETVNPYMVFTIEPSEGCAGDADGDYDVNILDATYMQRIAAGVDLPSDLKTADVTGDNAVSLKDAVALRKYLAGKPDDNGIGNWLFASETN